MGSFSMILSSALLVTSSAFSLTGVARHAMRAGSTLKMSVSYKSAFMVCYAFSITQYTHLLRLFFLSHLHLQFQLSLCHLGISVPCQFPGQGAQTVGMAQAVCDELPAAKTLFEKASSILGYDLLQTCIEVGICV